MADAMRTPGGLAAHRDAFIGGLRAYHGDGRKVGRTRTLSYLLRHAAYHVMDHAWELEGRDLAGQAVWRRDGATHLRRPVDALSWPGRAPD